MTVEPVRLRLLPAPHLLDHETHLAPESADKALCGTAVMYADPGHPTTKRPRCPDCQHIGHAERALDDTEQTQVPQAKAASANEKDQAGWTKRPPRHQMKNNNPQ